MSRWIGISGSGTIRNGSGKIHHGDRLDLEELLNQGLQIFPLLAQAISAA